MSNIMIIGGHGKVALQLTRLLTSGGHQVTSVVRQQDHVPEVEATGADAALKDVQEQDTEALTRLFAGQDVIVWSAGAGGGDPQRTYAVDRDAAIRSIDAARSAGVPRYVMVSYMGAGQDHGVPEGDDFFPYAQSKADADDHLRASELDWTILGPGRLTAENGSGTIRVGSDRGENQGATARANVALVAQYLVDHPGVASRRFVEFSDGETPVAQALESVG